MATWEHVRAAALGMPGTTEGPDREWRVRGRLFALRRPLRRRDLDELGEGAPADAPLAAWVADLDTKEALLAAEPAAFFTTSHFDGYPMVLVRLDAVGPDEAREVVVDAWLTRAPRTLARRWLAEHDPADGPDR